MPKRAGHRARKGNAGRSPFELRSRRAEGCVEGAFVGGAFIGADCVEAGCVEAGCVEAGCVEAGCVEAGCVEAGCVEARRVAPPFGYLGGRRGRRGYFETSSTSVTVSSERETSMMLSSEIGRGSGAGARFRRTRWEGPRSSSNWMVMLSPSTGSGS